MPSWRTPTAFEIEAASAILRPFELLFKPTLTGLDRVPTQGPLLFVGNHQLYAFDVPFLIRAYYRQRGAWMHGLADNAHFDVPLWGAFIDHFGMVAGNPATCAELMQAGEQILVFPGGAREALKLRDRNYQLEWGQRRGFARMALQNRCTIVPVAAVGVDESFHVLLDGDDYLRSPLSMLIDRFGLRRDALLPITLLTGINPIRFEFCEPIEMAAFDGMPLEEASTAVRDQTAWALESTLARMLETP